MLNRIVFMRLCVYAFMRLCVYAFMRLCVYAFMQVCSKKIKKRDPMKGPLKNPLARIKRGLVKTKNLVVFP
jgi:hypothetical protein